MEVEISKIPDTEEERTEAEVEKLLEKEKQLMYQNYLAPDLSGRWEGG